MQRSGEPKRRKPIARGEPPKRTAIKRKSKVRDSRMQQFHEAVLLRSGGKCEATFSPACTGRMDEAHHVVPRGRGVGWPWLHDADRNGLATCGARRIIHGFTRIQRKRNGWGFLHLVRFRMVTRGQLWHASTRCATSEIVTGNVPSMTIRQLKRGATIPPGDPRRYVNSQSGYVRLRWKVGVREYVETYEHRVVGDRVTNAEHVHHKNQRRGDNARKNLKPMTAVEHGSEHRRIDRARAVALYEEGQSVNAIARSLRADGSHVFRLLRSEGVTFRAAGWACRFEIDKDDIRRRHAQGQRGRSIASDLGVSPIVIRRMFRNLGLKPFPAGRPAKS